MMRGTILAILVAGILISPAEGGLLRRRAACCCAVVTTAAESQRVADKPKDEAPPKPVPVVGTLTGRFVFDGVPPPPRRLKVPPEFAPPPIDESLVIHPESRGIANVVVSLFLRPGETLAVPPKFDLRPRQATKEILMITNRFEPHIAIISAGEEFDFVNQDAVAHAPTASMLANDSFSILLKAKDKAAKTLPKLERLPVAMTDPIHPWMRGYLVITEHPFVAVSDADGRFHIDNLPLGELTIRLWQERSGYVEQVKHKGQAVKWSKGQVKLTIKPGLNELGDILVGTDEFPDAK